MRLAILALTEGGKKVAEKLADGFGSRATIYLKDGLGGPVPPGAVVFSTPLRQVVEKIFGLYDGHIFVMAMGIVVRMIAPYLEGKRTDPAVVAVDEMGISAISVLSGHVGGANDLAREAARILGGRAVITTATDVRGQPAVDLLAKQLGAKIESWPAVKKINAALVNGQKVGLFIGCEVSDLFAVGASDPDRSGLDGWQVQPMAALEGEMPWDAAVLITSRVVGGLGIPHVVLRPPSLIVGIGCRRGTPAEQLKQALETVLGKAGLSPLSVGVIASISLKADETGIIDLAGQLGAELRFFHREALEAAYRDNPDMGKSRFVREKIGVDGVCEPVLLLAGAETILVPKTVFPGITLAVGEAAWPLSVSAPETWNR